MFLKLVYWKPHLTHYTSCFGSLHSMSTVEFRHSKITFVAWSPVQFQWSVRLPAAPPFCTSVKPLLVRCHYQCTSHCTSRGSLAGENVTPTVSTPSKGEFLSFSTYAILHGPGEWICRHLTYDSKYCHHRCPWDNSRQLTDFIIWFVPKCLLLSHDSIVRVRSVRKCYSSRGVPCQVSGNQMSYL